MWMLFAPVPSRSTRQRYAVGPPFTPSSAILFADIPRPLLRATVYRTTTDCVLYEGSMASSAASPQTHHSTILSLIQSWSPFEVWPLQHSHFPNNASAVAIALKNGTAHGVCDGSYMPQLTSSVASAAWTLEDASRPDMDMCTGATLLTGQPDGVNAYRAELQGLHALLLATRSVVDFHRITSGSLSLYCDNERAVHLVSLRPSFVRDTFLHHDLLRAIQHLLHELPLVVSFHHIRGHQDQRIHPSLLSRPAQLNIHCDMMAKEFLLRHYQSVSELQVCRSRLKDERSWCIVEGRKAFSEINPLVTRSCTEGLCRDYLIRKGTISPAMWSLINWEAIGRAMVGQPDSFRLWASKFAYDQSATGVNMVRWHLWDSSACPCCGLPDETAWHVMQCNDPRIRSARLQGIQALETWLLAAHSDPAIIHCLTIRGLRDRSGFTSHHQPATVQGAAECQDTIGLGNTFLARLSLSWETLQGHYYQSISSRRSSRIWASTLALQLLKLCHRVWSARNQVVHDNTLGGAHLHEHNQLDQMIRFQFTLGDIHLLPEDLHLTNGRPLETILALPLVQRRLWVQSIQWARQHGERIRSAEAHSMSATMRNWLRSSHH